MDLSILIGANCINSSVQRIYLLSSFQKMCIPIKAIDMFPTFRLQAMKAQFMYKGIFEGKISIEGGKEKRDGNQVRLGIVASQNLLLTSLLFSSTFPVCYPGY